MDLEDSSDQELAIFTERIRNYAMGSLIVDTEIRGLKVGFIGTFKQKPACSPHEWVTSFVIAQSAEQAKLLEVNKLEGIVYELDCDAAIMGEISKTEIRFSKGYLPETDRLRKGKNLLVKYQGTSDNGLHYKGRWSFESESSDMETSGDFYLTRVGDIELVKRELERLYTESDDNFI